jgi:hypothetical protein
MNNIFFTGAPGSKWSSVVKNIYQSCDIDRSDYSDTRTYYHDADTPGNTQLMHIGVYWDPGMEFEPLDPTQWSAPFSGTGQRIVKSHVFAYHLEWLKQFECPIVIVYRNDYECYKWWKLCGEFSITYPDYAPYYQNLDNMWIEIQKQNSAIMNFVNNNSLRIKRVETNLDLCSALQISNLSITGTHNYKEKDITVYVYN